MFSVNPTHSHFIISIAFFCQATFQDSLYSTFAQDNILYCLWVSFRIYNLNIQGCRTSISQDPGLLQQSDLCRHGATRSLVRNCHEIWHPYDMLDMTSVEQTAKPDRSSLLTMPGPPISQVLQAWLSLDDTIFQVNSFAYTVMEGYSNEDSWISEETLETSKGVVRNSTEIIGNSDEE